MKAEAEASSPGLGFWECDEAPWLLLSAALLLPVLGLIVWLSNGGPTLSTGIVGGAAVGAAAAMAYRWRTWRMMRC